MSFLWQTLLITTSQSQEVLREIPLQGEILLGRYIQQGVVRTRGGLVETILLAFLDVSKTNLVLLKIG